jgi:uncharacterized protein YodC (DUF2158 family)
MRRRVMMVLASAALAGSLLATDAQARGGGGHAGGVRAVHPGGFREVHGGARVGGFTRARVEGIGGGYVSGIPRSAVGYVAGTRYGIGTGYGTGIRYGTGILHDGLLGLAASAYAQAATTDSATDISMPAPAQGAVQNAIGGPSARTGSGAGPIILGRDGVSTKTTGTKTTGTKTTGMAPGSSASAPSNTQNQAVPAFRSGNLVRLRSGGPLMTVKDIKGDQVECFWTDLNGQINADSFPVDVLQVQ